MSDSTPPLLEGITIDPDYAGRKGYDADFLGTGVHSVPLPVLPAELVALTAVNNLATGEPRYLLPYHHYSVVMNRERRLAFFTAVNIDGATSMRLKREKDRWFVDPRVPADEQTDEDVYRNNPLDRGHLVRRLDPAWGSSRPVAKASNDDTFHFTNCSPQHEDFNQNQTTWAGLEDYILENADNRDFRVTVFTGPVLAADDEEFAGVQLPRQFWKVVVMVKESGDLSATAYLLSQEAAHRRSGGRSRGVLLRRVQDVPGAGAPSGGADRPVLRVSLRLRPARRPGGHRRQGDQALRPDRALAGRVSHVGRDRRVPPVENRPHAQYDEPAADRQDRSLGCEPPQVEPQSVCIDVEAACRRAD